MKVQNKSSSKLIKFLNGKAFYAVLCVCFIAIGIAAWSGAEGLKRIETAEKGSDQSVTSTPNPDISSVIGVTSKPQASQTESTDKPDDDESTPSKPQDTSSKEPDRTEQTAAPVAKFFVNPVLGDILKDFSATELQYSMTMDDMRLHKAVDIAASAGTPVIASGEGVVIEIYKDAMYGTTVVIDHGNGIVAKYCGLNAVPAVKVGNAVDSSTQLGVVDVIPCESVEQRHLHLEFFKDGKSVSPMDYIIK